MLPAWLQKGQSNFDINFGFSFFICFFAVLRLPISKRFLKQFYKTARACFSVLSSAAMDSASLNKLKVAELQAMLRERGLPASGNKAELVQVNLS